MIESISRFGQTWAELAQRKISDAVGLGTSATMIGVNQGQVVQKSAEAWTMGDWGAFLGIVWLIVQIAPRAWEFGKWLLKHYRRVTKA